MTDETENFRRWMVVKLNSAVKSSNSITERNRLERIYGEVWNTQELQRDFEVIAFMAPYVVVKHKGTEKIGTLLFQHSPRFYFSFLEDPARSS